MQIHQCCMCIQSMWLFENPCHCIGAHTHTHIYIYGAGHVYVGFCWSTCNDQLILVHQDLKGSNVYWTLVDPHICSLCSRIC